MQTFSPSKACCRSVVYSHSQTSELGIPNEIRYFGISVLPAILPGTEMPNTISVPIPILRTSLATVQSRPNLHGLQLLASSSGRCCPSEDPNLEWVEEHPVWFFPFELPVMMKTSVYDFTVNDEISVTHNSNCYAEWHSMYSAYPAHLTRNMDKVDDLFQSSMTKLWWNTCSNSLRLIICSWFWQFAHLHWTDK